MNRKLWAGAAAVALVAGTVTVVAAAPASAHTPSIQVDCSTLSVNLSNYAAEVQAKPAEGTPTIDVPNPDYKAAWDEPIHHDAVGSPTIPNPNYVPAKDAVPAQTHTQYLYKQIVTGHEKWLDSKTWNPGFGWYFAGQTREFVDVPGQDAVPAQGEPTIPNPDYVPASDDVIHHDAVGTPTIVVDNPDYKAPVDAKANHATIVVDGVTKVDRDFSTSLHESITFDNKYVAHTYSVKVTAWDNDKYNVNESGTTTPCAVPVVDAKTAASIQATCGAADLTVTNPEEEWTDNKTGAVTVWIDGKFKEAISVAGDATETRHYTFAEDSGDHTVVVKNAEFAGGEKLAEATVSSDCAPNLKVIEKVVAPEATDVCGTDNDAVKVGKGEGYIEEVKWNADRSEATVKALASEGYKIADGVKTEWTFKFTNVPCATDTPKPGNTSTPAAAAPVTQAPAKTAAAPTDVLAFTGSDAGLGYWVGGGAIALLLVGAGIVWYTQRRKVTSVTTSDEE